jgi:hypothetical protein
LKPASPKNPLPPSPEIEPSAQKLYASASLTHDCVVLLPVVGLHENWAVETQLKKASV